jgi:arabinofuranosyltransferase
VLLVVAGWQRRWTTDDGFINLRIVRMLLEGHGPVFNAGERVEAYTSPLWVAILSVGDVVLPVRLEYVAVLCSLALAGTGMALLCAGSARLTGGVVPFGALVLLALPPVWDFSTSGLEFGLTFAWLGSVLWVLARWADDGRLGTAKAVVLGLGPLVRPDAALYSLAALVVVLVVDRRWRLAAVALALPVAYQLFRMAWFGALVPNTALAKAADVPHWREGGAYVWNLLRPYALWGPLAVVAAGGVAVLRRAPRRHVLAAAALPAAGVVHAAYIVRAGGDYQHGRLLLPALVAIVAPIAVVPARRALVVPAGAVAVWAAVTAVALRVDGTDVAGRTLIADGRAVIVDFLGVAHPVTVDDVGAGAIPLGVTEGVWVDDERLPVEGVREPVVILRGIGVTGYALGPDVYVYDRVGLANAVVSRFEVHRPGFVGHEKPAPAAWIAAQVVAPDDVVEPDVFGSDVFAVPLYESPAGQFDDDVAAARRALGCGRLAELRDATTEPFTVGRAFENLWRSFSLTALRIEPDPNEQGC